MLVLVTVSNPNPNRNLNLNPNPNPDPDPDPNPQTHADTTIGGNQDFAWIASKTGPLVFDRYTGADLTWAYNTPLLRLGGDSWFVLVPNGP